MDEMLHHTKAVNRAVEKALLVGDMPYVAYQLDPQKAVYNARRFIEEGGCDAVKIEWFEQCTQVVEDLIAAGMAVMGHVGLTPQTAEKLGGYKVQGKESVSAKNIMNQAKTLESLGCFSVVLECIPDQISDLITQNLNIPTIGIGAGVHCDGQVLVTHDMLGLFDNYRPKFVKQYADARSVIVEGIKQFKKEVTQSIYPDGKYSYSIKEEELKKLDV